MARVLARRLEGGDWPRATGSARPPRPWFRSARALRQGAAGPTQDLHLIVRPWGFDLTAVAVPVRIWHGDQDPEIPLHHGRYLADAVPDGQLEVMTGGDHLALYAHGRRRSSPAWPASWTERPRPGPTVARVRPGR